MLRCSGVMGMTAILFLVSAVPAQPPGGPGRGGFGGPGRLPESSLTLLRMPEVRKELGTRDGQNKQIDDLLADVQNQTRAAFDKITFQELSRLGQEERDKRFAQARKESEEANKKAEDKLGKILDAKQLARLNQLQLQREGVTAFNRPEVARRLGLTDDQKDKLRKLPGPNAGPFPPGPRPNDKALADALALLTADQKAKWQEMKGKEFKFPPPRGGFMGAPARKLVKEFDKDGNGRLNVAERQAARAALKKERESGGRGGFGFGGPRPGGFGPGNFLTRPLLQALDADKDGKLTREELIAGIKQFFTASDKDKKGSLQEAQIAEGINRVLPQRPGFPGGPPGGPGGPPGGGFGPGNFIAGEVVRRADANKDGKVTLDELLAAAEGRFKEADKNKDGKLDENELGAAVALLMPGPPGFGGRENREPPKPGPRVSPAEVPSYPNAGLYEPTVLRTLFLEFETKDWEGELADFKNTDVEVPATLTVDGKKYPKVGVRFRGMSSFGGVRAGFKRSFNLSLDFVDKKQRLYGYKTLNLLNSHEDPSFLSTVLYSHIARQYIPAPKANFVKVVINGESWGVYVNAQQFNKEFVAENYKSGKGARWKVRGSPGGGGGLEYLGENLDEYKRRYQIKSQDNDKDWKAFVTLCRVLNQTPPDKLEAALKPILDIDSVLWFLALDNALINNDGYWVRASDYSIFRDRKGVFRLIPHDINEAFQGAMGFGFGPGPGRGPGGPGGGAANGPGARPRPSGVELDPLIASDDPRKPLRSRLLAVPALRARYLDRVRTIAEKSLDWKNLGPVVAQYRSLIEKEIESDTRKLSSYDAFRKAVSESAEAETSPGRRPSFSLRAFAEQRRRYLLDHPEIKKVASSGGKSGGKGE